MYTESELKEQQDKDNGYTEALASEHREQRDELRNDVQSAAAAVAPAAESADDFETARAHLEELSRRYPGSVKATIEEFTKWDERMRADPVNVAHEFAERYLRSRVGFQDGKQEQKPSPFGWKETKLPSGQTHVATAGSLGAEVAEALAQTERDKDWRAAHELFSTRYPGERFSVALRSLLDIDKAAATNPYNAAARVAALYNMPLTDEQVREQAARQRLLPSVQQEVAAFQSDTVNYPRYQELRATMIAVLNEGKARTLDAAYSAAAKIADEAAKKPKPQPQLNLQQQLEQRLAANDKTQRTGRGR